MEASMSYKVRASGNHLLRNYNVVIPGGARKNSEGNV